METWLLQVFQSSFVSTFSSVFIHHRPYNFRNWQSSFIDYFYIPSQTSPIYNHSKIESNEKILIALPCIPSFSVDDNNNDNDDDGDDVDDDNENYDEKNYYKVK